MRRVYPGSGAENGTVRAALGRTPRTGGERRRVLRVVTCNLNGIRAAARKGVFAWLRDRDPDVVCFQETKAHAHQLPPEAAALAGYSAAFEDAVKPGYSGVAIFSRRPPDAVVRGLGMADLDPEGRSIRCDFGDVSITSIYMPSGTSGPARQAIKNSFLERYLASFAAMRHDGRRHIVCGDFNVAHRAIDVFDAARAGRTTGFLPHEREWFETVISGLGWVDAFRAMDPAPGRYSWWSNAPGAFEKNLGWRIDYQLVSPELAPAIRAASIYREARFSDHAPVTVDYAMDLPA